MLEGKSELAVQPGISEAAKWYMGLKAEAMPGADPAGGETEGQGANDGGMDPGMYPGIENVPSEYRQHIDPILKEMDANANRRIAEVNNKLEAWKPYEELGIRDNIDPETMQGLVGLVEMLGSAEEDPTALKEWWETLGNQFGFQGEEPEGEEGEEYQYEGEGESSPEDIKQIVAEAMEEQMQPFRQKEESREREEVIGQANQRIDDEFAQIQQKFGKFSEDEQKQADIEARIVRLAMPYATENDGEGSILKGFQEYQSILQDGEGQLFQEVSQQPNTPEGPGVPDTTKEKPTDMKSAEEIARNRLAEFNKQ